MSDTDRPDDELHGTVDVDDEIYETGLEPIDLDAGEVDALAEAGWHLRQLRHLRHELAKVNDLYDVEMSRIVEWRDREVSRLNNRTSAHETVLRQLSEALNRRDSERKTVNLPDGALKLRIWSAPKAVIDDDDALLKWAIKSAPALLPAPKRVGVMDLRRETVVQDDGKVVYVATGEVVPGVHGEVPPASWTCDTDTESAF